MVYRLSQGEEHYQPVLLMSLVVIHHLLRFSNTHTLPHTVIAFRWY